MSTTPAVRPVKVGVEFETARRTITDTDIINFAGLSGDFNDLHINDQFAASHSPFGTRIAHGQLIASIVTGLSSQLDEWPVESYIGASRKFAKPVVAGDTIYGGYKVTSSRSSRSRPESMVVILELNVINQDGDIVMHGEETMLVSAEANDWPSADAEELLYLQDIAPGRAFSSSRRSITEADIIWYSGISGDHSLLHSDLTHIKEKTDFRDRLAQGWLVVSIQSGLRTELKQWQIMAYLEADYRFRAPVYPGDTIEATYIVQLVEPSRSKPDRGVVTIECTVTNETGDAVMVGIEKFMVAARPS